MGDKPLSVGRHGSNAIVIDDNNASRFHCVIERSPRGIIVRDLNSKNGTILNGQRITERSLRNGDTVSIGAVRIRMSNGATARTAPAVDDNDNLGPIDLDALAEVEAGMEELSAEDVVVEDLGDSDLVAEDDELASPAFIPEDDSPLPMEIGDDDIDLTHESRSSAVEVSVDVTDFSTVLSGLIDAMPEPHIPPGDIALINARGQVVHPAGKSKSSSQSDAVEALRGVLLICLRNRATDMHLEPKADMYIVRVRVDGMMVEVVRVSQQVGVRIAALVKVLSDIDIAQRNTIQEGHFSASAPTVDRGRIKQAHRIDYRVSFTPAVHGQKMVVRVLDATNAPSKLTDLQLPSWMEQTLATAITQESGMVLVVGPTGSGKTTSLYSLIRTIDAAQLNVMTIEDPVEIELENVTQIPVDEDQDRSFSALLRSLLRQDPDVIMVGEVRDPETARIAMQAAITGHLVFSTLHTKDSIGTMFRLLDLGVEPYLVAQALQVVLAQRLTRQLCPFCKVAVKPTQLQRDKMAATIGKVDHIFAPRGCPKCLKTGFTGRRAFFELLSMTDALRDVILTKPSLEEIKNKLVGSPFRTLEHNGHLLVAQGVASFDEIDKAAVR